MTQLVELQRALPRFEAAGVRLYAVSYDEVEALAEFARHHGITYPLLSDRGSKVIDSYGIRNHFVGEHEVPYYGIPFPGTYLVDERGHVAAKLFHRNLAHRESAEAMLDGALESILLGEDEPRAVGGDDDVRVTAAFHGGEGTLKPGLVRQIVVRFELAPGLHVYGDPVPKGMVATRIQVSGPPGLHAGEPVARPTHPLSLPGLDFELSVWDGQVDFAIPVWIDDRVASLVTGAALDEVPIEVRVDYQACDDQCCRIPRGETLTVRVPVAPLVGHHVGGKLDGAVATTMRSRWFLIRMVARGLWRSPLAGLRYLVRLGLDIWRGPAGRAR
ncbi:MAG: redoxin domain-containing protein [Sandaracinaceae bacterium]|nr:redoxin domain-containing protein [Sandaracinaceae bacterium]